MDFKMISETDEKKGLVRIYWKDIRARIGKIEPKLTKIIDELNPDHTFPLYLAYLPYGTLKGDTISWLDLIYIPR